MSTSTLILKNPRGWFAAGAEVHRTMTLLSDGAFKLFIYLCLNARRDSGILEATQADLARGLKKTTATIRRNLAEMEAVGVLSHKRFTHHPRGRGAIQIAEAFWPYQTSEPRVASQDPDDTFVAEIRKMLEARACVQAAFSVADEILAREWLAQGITLEQVDQVILLGCIRKYVSWRNNPAHGPIVSLQYFAPVLEEVKDQTIAPDYWGYLRYRLQRMEELWKQAHAKADSEVPEEEALSRAKRSVRRR